LHGLFTVNLGVYVPEVARHYGGEAKSWVQDCHCCVRVRLGEASGESQDIWWRARPDDAVIGDVRRRLELHGLPFLERFSTRDKLLAELQDRPERMGASSPARIVMAIILTKRGDTAGARALLVRQVLQENDPRHTAYVRRLAEQLDLGSLEC